MVNSSKELIKSLDIIKMLASETKNNVKNSGLKTEESILNCLDDIIFDMRYFEKEVEKETKKSRNKRKE